ncbi:MAG TPA: FAD-binding protein, partial [Polyangiaceae bacterium]|nr:FAD-binding protein [Polyangiaceae bacterium]
MPPFPSKWPEQIELELGLDDAEDETALRNAAARKLAVSEADLPRLILRRRTLDARRGRPRFHLLLQIGVADGEEHPALLPDTRLREVTTPHRVVVVGAGPAGLLCAYELARHGIGSIVVDRGKLVQPRRRDLKGLNRLGKVDPDSNYCFGEGGAGTYSDGKLYTRADKRGDVRDILETLVRHGAPSEILVDARPHIGSNRLPKVVTALRESLQQVGVEFRFEQRVTRLLVEQRAGQRVIAGVAFADGSELSAEQVVLATGHSARDVVQLL